MTGARQKPPLPTADCGKKSGRRGPKRSPLPCREVAAVVEFGPRRCSDAAMCFVKKSLLLGAGIAAVFAAAAAAKYRKS